MRHHSGLAALVAALALPGAASAASAPAGGEVAAERDAPGPRFVAGVGTVRYVAEEPLPDGRVFNREQGTLRRVHLGVDLGVGQVLGGWSLQAALAHDEGTIDYSGQTQLGLPLNTLTDLARRSLALTAGRAWQADEGGPTFTLTWGAERLRTVRDIRATPISSALTETLNTRQWLLGAAASAPTAWASMPGRVGVSLQARRPWSHTLTVDTHGVVDPLELRPGRRWGGRLGLEASLSLRPSVEVGANLGFETYRPGSSATQTAYRDGLPVGSASYPGSVQTLRQLGIVLAWRL